MLKRVLLILSIVIFAGCSIGPNYQRPDIDAPQSWRISEKEVNTLVNTLWWEQFNDPILNSLIETALRNNRDIKIASARIEEFIGKYSIVRSALFPQIGTSGTYGRQKISELTGISPIEKTALDPMLNSSQLLLTSSWEIDLWGRLRRSTESARAILLSKEEAKRAIISTLVTSVASAYIDLRDLDKQLQIAIQTASVREKSYNLFKIRFEGGLISELELNQVKSEYEQALATIPQFEKNIVQAENYLSILLGQNPDTIKRGKSIDQLVLPSVPSGVPSDILMNRPDILQAEQELISANANIGVARSLYFPNISLTGVFGFASNDLSDLFKGPARTWSWSVPVTMPIFTAGSIEGQIKSAEAQQGQALLHYQQVIQSAFREVEDALIDYKKTRQKIEAQSRQVESLKNYARIARIRYDNGYTSYIEVLDAERSLFSAELLYTKTQRDLFLSLINIYKSMGGGWILKAEEMTKGK